MTPNQRKGIERWLETLWRADNYHLKRWATNEYRKAIGRGDIVPEPCSICGKEKAHGHHEDYAKPFEVVWLCPLHHTAAHRYREEHERGQGHKPGVGARPCPRRRTA